MTIMPQPEAERRRRLLDVIAGGGPVMLAVIAWFDRGVADVDDLRALWLTVVSAVMRYDDSRLPCDLYAVVEVLAAQLVRDERLERVGFAWRVRPEYVKAIRRDLSTYLSPGAVSLALEELP